MDEVATQASLGSRSQSQSIEWLKWSLSDLGCDRSRVDLIESVVEIDCLRQLCNASNWLFADRLAFGLDLDPAE
jgi:hypothetical protein